MIIIRIIFFIFIGIIFPIILGGTSLLYGCDNEICEKFGDNYTLKKDHSFLTSPYYWTDKSSPDKYKNTCCESIF